MKKLLILFAIFASINCFCKEVKIIYLMQNGKETNKEAKATYILELENDNNKYRLKKYLIKNKKLLVESELSSYNPYIEDGESVYYDKDSDNFIVKGFYSNGELFGEWVFHTNKGYDTISYNRLPNVLHPQVETYSIVEKMPFFNYYSKFSSDIEIFDYNKISEINKASFNLYIQENLHYPVRAKEKGIKGPVYVSFVINENGEVVEGAILRGLNKDLEMEALRLINSMPNWINGEQKGKPVRVKITMEVKFE